jgi:hypothetical protein
MSPLSHQQILTRVQPMSAILPNADIAQRDRHVRFAPKAD